MQPVTFTEDQLNTQVSALCSQIMAGTVANQSFLSGQDLLGLHSHSQVNQFVLFQLFTEWNAYMQRVRHPHFDFDHPDVAAQMDSLRITLSHHIKLPAEALKPMLSRAVYNSLRLLLAPWDTLVNFFFADKDQIKLDSLARYAPFFQDFDFIVQALLNAYEKRQVRNISREDFMEKLEKAANLYESKGGRSLDSYREERFFALTGQTLGGWMAPPAPKTGINTLPKPNTSTTTPTEHVEPTPTPQASSLGNGNGGKRLADKFQAEKAKPQAPTVAKTPLAAKDALGMDSIPLHKQFQYIQKVFGADKKRMADTLSATASLGTAAEVREYLQKRIFNMPDNAHDDKINEEFAELVCRRFQ